MKSIKFTIFVFVVMVLFSCKDVVDMSVTKPMTLEEIKEATDQFKDFGKIYDQISYVMSKMSPSEKAEYTTLSYADYYQYQKDVVEMEAKWDDIATKEWEVLHGWKVTK